MKPDIYDSSLSSALAEALARARHEAEKAAGTVSPRLSDTAGAPGHLMLRNALMREVSGQDAAVDAVSFMLFSHISKKAPARPLSLIFHGPTGVGKSRLGKSIAPVLSRLTGKHWDLNWTELNTFTEPHSVHRLTGAPPGYVGYEDPPIFDAVRKNPYTVFMFDELEKAHPEILKAFMSVLDEGRASSSREDKNGRRELDFRCCVFIFTTNADLKNAGCPLGFSAGETEDGAPFRHGDPGGAVSLARRIFSENEVGRRALMKNGALKEIAGRFSGIIGFSELDYEARLSVTRKQIEALGQEYGLEITGVTPETVRSLMPRDAFSVRSNVSALEGALTELFVDFSRRFPFLRVSLSGTPEKGFRLFPAQGASAPRDNAFSKAL